MLKFVQEAHITRKDSKVQEIIYQQAVEDVSQCRINVDNHSQELESLRLQERKDEVYFVCGSMLCLISWCLVFGADQIFGVVQFCEVPSLHV